MDGRIILPIIGITFALCGIFSPFEEPVILTNKTNTNKELIYFKTIFTGLGLAILSFAIKEYYDDLKEKIFGEITKYTLSHSSRRLLKLSFICAIILSPLTYLTTPYILKHIQDGQAIAYLVLFIPLLFVFFSGVTIYLGLRHISFGESTLEINSEHGLIGGKLDAYIITNCAPKNGFDIIISCTLNLHKRDIFSGIVQFTEHVNSKDYSLLPDGKVKTKFSFDIPYDTPSSEDEGVTWRIDVKSNILGPNYSSSFKIPVYKRTQSNSNLSLKEKYKEQTDQIHLLSIPQEKLKVNIINDTLYLSAPIIRYPYIISSLIIILSITTILTTFFFQYGIWIFFSIFILIDISLFVVLGYLIFMKRKTIIDKNGITIKKGFWVFKSEEYFPAVQIHKIEVNRMPSKNNYIEISLTNTNDSILIDQFIYAFNHTLILKNIIDKILMKAPRQY